MHIFLCIIYQDSRLLYSDSQNNLPFQPPDNLVKVGKNSQIKARKSEHGSNYKNRLRQYELYSPN